MTRFKPSMLHFINLMDRQKLAWDSHAHMLPRDVEYASFVDQLAKHLEGNEYDFFVSPGNSYGIMSGGYDGVLVDIFGRTLQDEVQRHIHDQYAGECQVGNAFAVRIPSAPKKVLIYAPTMRVPKRLFVNDDVVYRSIWAAMVAMEHWTNTMVVTGTNKSRVLFTAHGGATGAVPPGFISWQMMYALHRFFIRRPITNLFVEGGEHDNAICNEHAQ